MPPITSKLLVSVRSATEAETALATGADLIDIKEPKRGSLGRADADIITSVLRAVDGRRPVSAALGELRDLSIPAGSESDDPVGVAVASGSKGALAFVKFGLAGCLSHLDWRGELEIIATEMQQPSGPALVAVAYADWELAQSPPVREVLEFAGRRPGGGLLIDTSDKADG